MRSADVRHVLMTADAVGGVWTYSLDLAAALGDHGVRVSLAILGPPPSRDQRAAAVDVPNLALHEYPCRLEWMDEPWDDVRASGDWLLQLRSSLMPDVVHLNGYCHATLDWQVPVVVAAHSCVLSWWRAVYGDDAPPRYGEYRERVASGVAAADLVVAPTAAMLSMLDTHYGPLRFARMIRNGRRMPPVTTAKEPFVITAGRIWDEAKNVAAVTAAAQSLPWAVYVAGDRRGPAGEDVQLPGVSYLGVLGPDEMAQWMARAAIFALPARYEPFGLTAVEAALLGCALVLGDIRSQRELWGDAAVYVKPDDRHALVTALRALIEDEVGRTRLARRARALARQMTPAQMASDYVRAYADARRVHQRTLQAV